MNKYLFKDKDDGHDKLLFEVYLRKTILGQPLTEEETNSLKIFLQNNLKNAMSSLERFIQNEQIWKNSAEIVQFILGPAFSLLMDYMIYKLQQRQFNNNNPIARAHPNAFDPRFPGMAAAIANVNQQQQQPQAGIPHQGGFVQMIDENQIQDLI